MPLLDLDMTAPYIDICDVMSYVDDLEARRENEPGTFDAEDRENLAALHSVLAALCNNGAGVQWRGRSYPELLVCDLEFSAYIRATLAKQDMPRGEYLRVRVGSMTYWYR